MEDKISYSASISDFWIRCLAPDLMEREDYWIRLMNLNIHSTPFLKSQIINIMARPKDFSSRIRDNVIPSFQGKERIIAI